MNGDNFGGNSDGPQGSWAQAAGKDLSSSSLPPNSLNGNSGQSPSTTSEGSTVQHDQSTSAPADQEAEEFQLKAAFSEGWGQSPFNQDSPWEIPITPPPENGKESQFFAVWRAPVSMGTEIWENNLRMNKDGACGSDVGSSVWTPSDESRSMSNWSPVATPKKETPPSGWEPPSPPGGSYDDGTAVWGNPQSQGKVSLWEDMPSAKLVMSSNSNIVGPNGMLENMAGMPQSSSGMIRLPSNKNDASSICKGPPPFNGDSNWLDMPLHRDSQSAGNWGEDNSPMQNLMQSISGMQGGGRGGEGAYDVDSWNDQTNNSMQYWGARPKSNCNWADGQIDTSSWLGPAKQSGKPLCKNIVHASNQFRTLSELELRKEDIENSLRNNMNLDEALAELQAMQNGVMDADSFAGLRTANIYDDMPVSDSNLDSLCGHLQIIHTEDQISRVPSTLME